LQAEAEVQGSEHLHRMLAELDPTAAREIAPRDTPKLIRALEVCLQARRPRTELFRAGREPLADYRVVKLGLLPERKALYARIEQRVDEMLDAGWLEEARRLRERFGDGVKPFGFLGYKQLAAHLRGELSLKDAIQQTKHETRQFAKRQITWFRKESRVERLAGFGDDSGVQADARERARAAYSD
jgi:tRNA dimethylallyltransferase